MDAAIVTRGRRLVAVQGICIEPVGSPCSAVGACFPWLYSLEGPLLAELNPVSGVPFGVPIFKDSLSPVL
jgi:hypothetical protein